jgi:hypothetical protein
MAGGLPEEAEVGRPERANASAAMNSTEIVKHILEGDLDDFSPADYVKSAKNRESAVEVYNGPLVRVIQPLTAATVSNYLPDDVVFDDAYFTDIAKSGPIYLAVDKSDHDNMVIFQPASNKAWNKEGREQDWKSIPELISSAKPQSTWDKTTDPKEDKNWLDLQQGLATYFMAQIARKKNVGQWVKYLTMIGRTDLATNYARYLGRAKLPFGKSIDAVLSMKKAGKRSRNRIARLMKNQENVKWGEQGFWLLFDDYGDLAQFFDDEGSRYDFKKNAEKVFNNDAREWFDSVDSKPEEVWGQLNDSNLSVIKQLLINRTVYNSDGEEHPVTKENVEELTDDEVKDIVCDRGNKNDSCEDIYDAIRFGADDAYASEMESAYFDGYKHALLSEFGLQDEKTFKWINVGKREPDKKLEGGMVERGAQKQMLGMYFPYSTLEDWIKQWKKDEYEDDYYGDIHDLAVAYLPKVRPNEDYSGNSDPDYFNEQVAYRLDEIKPSAPEKAVDPAQPELPLEGEPDPQGREIERPKTVSIGHNVADQKVYKNVPSSDASKYYKAMGGKIGDQNIYLRAEALLAQPIDRLDERQGDVKIEFEASAEAAESVVPLLKELKKMGSQGSSRNIKIEDWEGRDKFGFDGDGASKIGDITVNGKVVEARGRRTPPPALASDFDAKAFVVGHPELHLPSPSDVEYDVQPHEEHEDFHGHFTSDEPELDRQLEQWIEGELERGNLWAWCSARVSATWTDPVAEETFHGYAYLGGCNYKSEEDFCAEGGYYPQMKEEAYEDLIKQIEKRRGSMGESITEAQQLDEAIYKLSTTQIDLPKEIGGHIIQWGELNIADDDLYIDEKDGCGRETEQHVTVLYGLTDSTPSQELIDIVESTKPFLIEFAGVSIFENEKYDVVKLSVVSEGLHNLHMQIRKACPNENKFPDYLPHCTVAYVKKGTGKKYEGNDVFKSAKVPRDFWAYDLLFKGAGDSEDADRVVQLIHFDKSKPIEEPDEPEAGDQRYPKATEEEPEMAVAENLDPKAFLARNVPVDCPECHSTNLSEPDDEGLVDCLGCGIWFDPLHPENKPVRENIDPKKFTENPKLGLDLRDWVFVDRDEQKKSSTYREKSGRVQFTLSYLGRGKFRVHVTSVPDGSEMSDWEDFPAESHSEAEATAMNLAYDMVHNTNPALFQPVREAEEINTKEFLDRSTRYRVRLGVGAQTRYLWREAGSQMMWKDFDEASLFTAEEAGELVDQIGNVYGGQPVVAELVDDGHPEQHLGENVDPKDLAMRVPQRYIVKTPLIIRDACLYLALKEPEAGEFGSATTVIDRSRATQFSLEAAEKWVAHLNSTRPDNEKFEAIPADMQESLAGPFEDDGLPGEVSTFLRKVRSKRKPAKRKGQPII